MAKKLLRVLAGEAVWPPPMWLMRQAGRYLPEYREVRAQAGGFIDLCTNPALATEVTLQPLRRYGFDAAILFSDILMLPWALGQGLRFAEGEGPQLPPIRDEAGLDALDPARLPKAIEPILETVQRLSASVGDATLIGFAGSPFTVACYMVQGSGSKEWDHVRLMAMVQPGPVRPPDRPGDRADHRLSFRPDRCRRRGGHAVRLLGRRAGAVAVPGACDRALARASPPRIRARHPGVPVIGFPRQAGTMLGRVRPRDGRAGREHRHLSRPRGRRPRGAGERGHPGQSRSAGAGGRRGSAGAGDRCRCWRPCAGGRSSSTWGTASCRRPRRSMSPNWWPASALLDREGGAVKFRR